MTDEAKEPDPVLLQRALPTLIATWRARVEIAAHYGNGTTLAVKMLARCADELDAALSAERPQQRHELAALQRELGQLRQRASEIWDNPEQWMRWCDIRVLERAETAEASLALLRSQIHGAEK